jgi:hypothetical protein
MHHKRALAIAVLVCIHAACDAAPAPTVAGKKIIKIYGLDKPEPAYLRKHVAEIEKTGFDGICIVVPTDEPKAGKRYRKHGNYLWFSGTPLAREDFARGVEDLKQTKFARLCYNFLHYTARSSGPFDWSMTRSGHRSWRTPVWSPGWCASRAWSA